MIGLVREAMSNSDAARAYPADRSKRTSSSRATRRTAAAYAPSRTPASRRSAASRKPGFAPAAAAVTWWSLS